MVSFLKLVLLLFATPAVMALGQNAVEYKSYDCSGSPNAINGAFTTVVVPLSTSNSIYLNNGDGVWIVSCSKFTHSFTSP